MTQEKQPLVLLTIHHRGCYHSVRERQVFATQMPGWEALKQYLTEFHSTIAGGPDVELKSFADLQEEWGFETPYDLHDELLASLAWQAARDGHIFWVRDDYGYDGRYCSGADAPSLEDALTAYGSTTDLAYFRVWSPPSDGAGFATYGDKTANTGLQALIETTGARQAVRAALHPPFHDALDSLIAIARRDTHQSHHVAQFLLAWWHAESFQGWDVASLWALDRILRDHIVTILKHLAMPEFDGFYPIHLRADMEAIMRRHPDLARRSEGAA